MWILHEKKSLLKVIKKLPLHIRKYYELWKRIVELEGPQGLRLIKGYHDEALQGVWKGYRSSRLLVQWRVLYQVENKQFEVFIIDIKPT